jgi:hypothetical protein
MAPHSTGVRESTASSGNFASEVDRQSNADFGPLPENAKNVGNPEQEVGTQGVLSHQRDRGACNLSTQRREQRNVCSRAQFGPKNREVKACWLDSNDASRKAISTWAETVSSELRGYAEDGNLDRVRRRPGGTVPPWDRGSMQTEDAAGRHRC